MTRSELVAVVVVGKRNVTRITMARPLTKESLDSFARIIAKKAPDRTYLVVPISDTKHGLRQTPNREPYYRWHVGEGFEHHEGWWIDVGAHERCAR